MTIPLVVLPTDTTSNVVRRPHLAFSSFIPPTHKFSAHEVSPRNPISIAWTSVISRPHHSSKISDRARSFRMGILIVHSDSRSESIDYPAGSTVMTSRALWAPDKICFERSWRVSLWPSFGRTGTPAARLRFAISGRRIFEATHLITRRAILTKTWKLFTRLSRE